MNQISCLSHWFPRLVDAGIPVPKTQIIYTDIPLIRLCDGHTDVLGLPEFVASIKAAVRNVSGSERGPAFIRTGQGSGKHSWQDCCYFDDSRFLIDHIRNLVEWSHMVDFLGLPTNVWAVREYLPVKPVAILDRYGNMPLVREMRCFVSKGEVSCMHPYWPPGAVEQGLTDRSNIASIMSQMLVGLGELVTPIRLLAQDVAKIFATDEHHEWSVDILETEQGLYVTDMAVAQQSYHYPGCAKATQFNDE